MSSTKKLPTSAVTAGIRNIDPMTIPIPAATERIHASTTSAACIEPPSTPSAQLSPTEASHAESRSTPTAISTMRTSAYATDFHRIARNSGEIICERARTSASSIAIIALPA
jgi:hypothetical protein